MECDFNFLGDNVRVFIFGNDTFQGTLIGRNEKESAELFEFDESCKLVDRDREKAKELFPHHVLKAHSSYYIQQRMYTNVLPVSMVRGSNEK